MSVIPGYRRQRAVKGLHRCDIGTMIPPQLMKEVNRAARHFGVSCSWVIAQALHDYMGVPLERRDRYNSAASKHTAPSSGDIRLVKHRRVG
jgi:hypothetical protein